MASFGFSDEAARLFEEDVAAFAKARSCMSFPNALVRGTISLAGAVRGDGLERGGDARDNWNQELVGVYQPGSHHMVGDGFPVRNMIPGAGVDEQLSPLLDARLYGTSRSCPATGSAGWENIRIAGSKQ